MSDNYTQLNENFSAGDYMDESGITYGTAPTTRKRPRVVIAGDLNSTELASVINTLPVGSEYALIVRQNVPTYPGTQITQENAITSVPASEETNIISYTVPASVTFNFIGAIVSGNMDAVFRIYINSTKILTLRNTIATLTANLSFTSPPFTAATGSVVTITVYQTNSVAGDFEGTLFGYIA